MDVCVCGGGGGLGGGGKQRAPYCSRASEWCPGDPEFEGRLTSDLNSVDGPT